MGKNEKDEAGSGGELLSGNGEKDAVEEESGVARCARDAEKDDEMGDSKRESIELVEDLGVR
eukprot:13371472-Alexandrium_andersonii.AAC.1